MSPQELHINELTDSVDADSVDSKTRTAAQFLISAMNDWPTYGQSNLYGYLEEIRNTFGDNLTTSKLEAVNSDDIWKETSKTSLLHLLDLYPGETLDEAIENILNKYRV